MHVKKGDKVQVMTGKDKGKQGVVLTAMPKKDRVIVEGVNMIKKTLKTFSTQPARRNCRERSTDSRIERYAHRP